MRTKIKHSRLRPKPSQKNKKKITNEDKDYLEWLQNQDFVCFACGKQNGIEWHHVKECSTDKKNHQRLIPLCGEECHRNGQELSAHGTPKKFREVYPVKAQNAFADRIYSFYLKHLDQDESELVILVEEM